MRTLQAVKSEIETVRDRMVSVGMSYGLTHPLTVKISQDLDKLHNEHMQITALLNKKAEATKNAG